MVKANINEKILLIIIFLLLWRNCCLSAEESIIEKPSQKYNVILISVCSLRTDHLGCYGYHRNTSPNIDKLAKEGILFENAFSQASFTMGSLMSIYTSLYPESHGVIYPARDKLSTEVKTLTEILKSSVNKTVYFIDSSPYTDPDIGFGRGYDSIIRVFRRFEFEEDKKEKQTIFNWIEDVKNENFFFHYHATNVHEPYFSSLKYKQRFVKNYKGNIISSFEEFEKFQLRLIKQDLKNPDAKIHNILKEEIDAHPEIFQGEFNQKSSAQLKKLISSLPKQKQRDFEHIYGMYDLFRLYTDKDKPADVQHLKDLYDACILQFDENFVKPLVDKLKNLRIYDQTMIIIIGDHGEEFYEHNNYAHGATLYDEIIHVPLIIKLPKNVQCRQKRIKDLVQGIDIMPTVLDIFNIPIPSQTQGISLRGMWEDKKDTPKHKYVYAISSYGFESIRSRDYKLIYNLIDNGHEFYDLKNDPQEKKNIYEEKFDKAKKLEEDLSQWKKNLVSYIVKRDFPPDIDETAIERLKKTGYW
jgi:arylsulfatase A-like enzyme